MTHNIAGKQKGQPRGADLSTGLPVPYPTTTTRSGTRENSGTDTASLLEPYVIYKNDASGEWRLRCPHHWDVEGDCSLNLDRAVYQCFRCGRRGFFSELLAMLATREAEGFVPAWLSEPLRGSASPGHRPPPDGPPSAAILAAWHNHLLRSSDPLAYLTGPERLLTLDTIKRYGIGWNGEFKFYSIPIYHRSGELHSFKRYRRHRKPKMLNRRGDSLTLFPWSALRGLKRGDLLVVAEGEWDAMLLNQHGVPAVTGGGANVWRREWSVILRNLGVRVVVIYDCDESGREGRRKPLGGIPGSRAIDLAPSRTDGYDVTQYLRTHIGDELLAVVR